MDPFSTTSEIILDLIFLKLNQEDLHETLRVSKSWFWASIRRIKKLKIDSQSNPLKSMTKFYNHKCPNEEMDWRELFKLLVLDDLVVIGDKETTNHLVSNGCNTAMLTMETSVEETEAPVTFSLLKNVTRLQSFEYRNNMDMEWHPFIIECLKSSEFEFDFNKQCPIEAIRLHISEWNTKDPGLHSVTKLSFWHVTIGFLRTMVDHCQNLEEIRCSEGIITQEWHHVFPVNVKRIELHHFKTNGSVGTIVDRYKNAGRHLLPYLCQIWESVEKFHFDGYDYLIGESVYEAFPQQREEVFMCEVLNQEMNLANPLLRSREIHVRCGAEEALELNIPIAKSVKFEFDVKEDFKFSPRDVCSEPGEVEHLTLKFDYFNGIYPDPFVSDSFQGFCRLTSLTLFCVSPWSIEMALDQCPSIKKLNLKYLKAMTIGSISGDSSYANVRELELERCKEPVHKVFQVFPCLSAFKQSFWGNDATRVKATDWLWQHLIEWDARYGLVFHRTDETRYVVSDDFEASLTQAQKLLNESFHCELYVKGFKLIPRVATQKVIYNN